MKADEHLVPGNFKADPWRAVFDASLVPSAITRRSDGEILFVNRAWLDMLGWTEADVVGRTLVDAGFWIAPEQRASMLEQLRSTGVVRDLEQTITTRGGETIVALTSISPVVLDGVPCLVGHVHDITQSRRLEDKLRESEDRFRQVTETLEQGFLLRDTDPPAVLYASPALERMFGVEEGTLTRDPHTIIDLVHPSDRERVIARRDAMTDATDFEFRIVRPDGATRWIRSRAHPVRMRGGQMTRMASVSEDVTDERLLREALRESEERFRLLAENSTDVIARSAADWTIRYMSPACRALYGYEPEEMVGRSGWEFVHPEDQVRLGRELSADVSDAGDVINSYRVLRKDGGWVWVEAKTVTLTGPGGEVAYHTTARDITERMEAEAVIGRAQEEAVRANLAKSEFLSRMSHELRTPLHAILGFGELLAQEELKPSLREGLAQITKGGRHLLELINEVLDISSIERGELRMSLEPVHVGVLISEALELVAPLAAAGAIDLPAPGDDELDCHVVADRHRLKQVLLNLLSNAVKYTRPGGEVRVRVEGRPSERVRIEVADSGIGIAAENLSRVFAAFDRLGAETTDVEGTGLGLTLSKRLIEAMDGTIGVESEVGRGTRFWITLPGAEAPQTRQGAATAAPPPDAEARPQPAGRSVLYIEDNPSNIKLAEAILARRPEVTLLVATQGGLGLELAREHQPAVILLDLNLPDISGEEVLRRIRSDPRTATINVVVLSADATAGQIDRMRRAGANHYLTKPFEIVEFLAVIDGETDPAPAAADRGDRAAADDGEASGPLRLERVTKLRRLYSEEGELREFVELFVADIAERIETLEAAARAGDPAAVWQAAHAMRGSCSLAGAYRVEAQLAQIEAITRHADVPGADAIAALRSTFGEAERALFGELR